MAKECDNDVVHCRNKIIKNIVSASKTLPVNCHVFCDSDDFFEQVKSDFSSIPENCKLIKCNIKNQEYISKILQNNDMLNKIVETKNMGAQMYPPTDQHLTFLYEYCIKYLQVEYSYKAHISDIVRLMSFIYLYSSEQDAYYVYLDTDDEFNELFFPKMITSDIKKIGYNTCKSGNNNLILCNNESILYIPTICTHIYFKLTRHNSNIDRLYKYNMTHFSKPLSDKNYELIGKFLLFFIGVVAGPSSFN